VIGGFQCAKLGHSPNFRKTRPDARTGAEKEDVSGETRSYGNPTTAVVASVQQRLSNRLYKKVVKISLQLLKLS